jgi:ABC-type uncharacterized transport system permease subunit
LLSIILTYSAPLILAAMGGYMSERGGLINIGLEGMMLISAAVTSLVGFQHGAGWGLLAGVASATALSVGHWLVTQKFHVDHVISGMAVNAIALGGSNFLVGRFGKLNQVGSLAVIEPQVYVFVALSLPIVIWAYSTKTRAGLRLIAIGADPDKARLVGLRPVAIRFWALVSTGVFTGLAGAMLVSDTGTFTDNMTAGRGFIALAALIVGGWRPIPTALACLAFGFFSSLDLLFQGSLLPSEAWTSLPYIATVIALAGFLGKNRTPAGLGRA